VNHFDQFTSVTINFNLLPGVAIGDATKFIEDSFAQVHQQFPGVQATFQGEALVFRQLFRALPLLLIAAIFVMYVILGILYEAMSIRSRFCFRRLCPPSSAGCSHFGFLDRPCRFTA